MLYVHLPIGIDPPQLLMAVHQLPNTTGLPVDGYKNYWC